MKLLNKDGSNRKDINSFSLGISRREQSPPNSKKINYRQMILNPNEDKSFSNNNNKKYNHNNNIYNNYNIFNNSYTPEDKNKSIIKKGYNKSFDLNMNNNNKDNIYKKINNYYEKFYNIKNKNMYSPRLYKGPIDIKNLIISNRIDELVLGLIHFLHKNEIHYKIEKNNKYRLYCNKDDDFFEIEIFSVYRKNIDNKKNNKLFYFTYISKNTNSLVLKSCLDLIIKSFLNKFLIKNCVDK